MNSEGKVNGQLRYKIFIWDTMSKQVFMITFITFENWQLLLNSHKLRNCSSKAKVGVYNVFNCSSVFSA